MKKGIVFLLLAVGSALFAVAGFAQEPPPEPQDQTARFNVMKDFSDNNPMDVTVRIECNTGTILEQEFDLSEFPPNDVVEFVVEEWEDDSDFFCEITEVEPSGYTASYVANKAKVSDPDSCFFEGGSLLEQVNTCKITNDLDPVPVEIEKEWVFDEDVIGVKDKARIRLRCENVAGRNQREWTWWIDGDDTNTALVFPDFDGSTRCRVEERVFDSAVESTGCERRLAVRVGSSGTGCTITNTVFFEGIPTLSQWGMAIMALLMLGIGLIGFRRFA